MKITLTPEEAQQHLVSLFVGKIDFVPLEIEIVMPPTTRPYNKIAAIKKLRDVIANSPGIVVHNRDDNGLLPPTTSGYRMPLVEAKKLIEDLAAIILQ